MPAWLPRTSWGDVLRDLYALPEAYPGSVSPQAGMLLHALVLNAAPRTIVETGTFLGVSTIWMSSALQALRAPCRVHAFDVFDSVPWSHPGLLARLGADSQRTLVEGSLRRAGVEPMVTLHAGDSADQITRCAEIAAGRVQFAFLDGDHTETGVVRDFLAVEAHLETGGLVVLHDVFPALCGHAGPRYLIDNLHKVAAGVYERVALSTMPMNFGMAVLRRVG